ncbi:LapA family protein [Acetobacter sp. AN02]|uniref:LapA family protein n=1 Tax=Acetobacter sp. AN02 TaxID=2894186 RepID=UPI00243449D3|nr:LapA family protein [Acetobacter sp. AN02]MDG6094183.1 LapA family protein [Acetobacter sp. AN02]
MIRLILILPFFLALLVFAASNQEGVQLWMLYWSWQSSIGIVAVILGPLFFILGAFALWVTSMSQRRRASRAEQQIRELENRLSAQRDELERLRIQLGQPSVGGRPAAVAPVTSDPAPDIGSLPPAH